MKKKNIVVSVLLTGVLCIMSAWTGKAAEVSAVVEDNGISVCNLYSNTAQSFLSISNKQAKMAGIVKGIPGVTTKIHLKLTLQKYASGKWSAVQSYEKTVNATKCILSKTRAVSSGKYRLKAVYIAYKGAKSETTTLYSSNVSC